MAKQQVYTYFDDFDYFIRDTKIISIFFLYTDCEFLHTEDSWFVKGVTGGIQRADVARYMLKVVEEDLHHKKIVAISPKQSELSSLYKTLCSIFK